MAMVVGDAVQLIGNDAGVQVNESELHGVVVGNEIENESEI